MNNDDLGMLTDDQFEYSSLTEETLKKLVEGDDLFVATSALVELANRESKLAAQLAWEIVSNHLGDQYLQATAISILYDSDRLKALEYFKAQLGSCDHIMLNTTMEIMIENELDFREAPTSYLVEMVFDCIRKLKHGGENSNLTLIELFESKFSRLS